MDEGKEAIKREGGRKGEGKGRKRKGGEGKGMEGKGARLRYGGVRNYMGR